MVLPGRMCSARDLVCLVMASGHEQMVSNWCLLGAVTRLTVRSKLLFEDPNRTCFYHGRSGEVAAVSRLHVDDPLSGHHLLVLGPLAVRWGEDDHYASERGRDYLGGAFDHY